MEPNLIYIDPTYIGSLILANLNLIANLAVAIGTIAVAIYTYKSIKNSEKQLKFLKKQTDLFLLQQQPNIDVKKFGFKDNKMTLCLKNSGKGTAYDLAIASTYSIPITLVDSGGGLGQQRLAIPKIKEKKFPDEIRFIKTKRGILSNIISPANHDYIWEPDGIIIILRDKTNSTSLPEGAVKEFECEPIFQLKARYSWIEKICKNTNTVRKGLKLNDLKKLLSKNSINEIEVLFRLYSKDTLQNSLSHGRICNFLIIFSKNETLESAYNQDYGGHPIDSTEVKRTLTYISPELYFRAKYSEILEDEE